MAIDTALLVSAAMLQDYFVDNVTGQAMANGTITMYQDNSRTTLKNWYSQTGVPGNYTYVTLPNPLTLSAVGTIQDANGNDVIPFYYPYDETNNTTVQAYYVVVVNSDGQQQFTRQNFPFVSPKSTPTNVVATNKNYIANNVFWRNSGNGSPSSLNVSANLNTVIAPSQHDGFTMPDIRFIKNTTDATDTLTFYPFVPPSSGTTFSDQVLPNDVTPELYLNLNCTAAGTETLKYVQFPVSLHIKSLSGYTTASIVVQAMNVPGNTNNKINIYLYQYLGTGVVSPTPAVAETIVLSDVWTKYTINVPMPTAANVITGNGGDDGWFVWIGYPTAVTCNINIAKPAFYLSNIAPTNDFDNYDQVNTIISSPRTGDIRTSINSYYPNGWIPMNGGTIGNGSSNATSRANIDTWPLFNLLWGLFSPYNSGTTNVLAQMVNSGGSGIAYGGSAIADFNANHAITLTQTMGKVLLGTVPFNALLSTNSNTFIVANDSGRLLIEASTPMLLFTGMPIKFSGGSLPATLSPNVVYYVSNFDSATSHFNVAHTFEDSLTDTSLIAFASGTGTVTANITGSFEGEYAHTLNSTELPDPITTSAQDVTGTGAGFSVIASSSSHGSGVISNNGGNQPHNVTQPGYFMNLFMKL